MSWTPLVTRVHFAGAGAFQPAGSGTFQSPRWRSLEAGLETPATRRQECLRYSAGANAYHPHFGGASYASLWRIQSVV